MNNKTLGIIVILVALLVGLFFWQNSKKQANTSNTTNSSTSTPPGSANYGKLISDGTISIPIPKDFGLAVTSEQILVKSYIPPCDENFSYCLYYIGKDYEGTNFESAGIRVTKRNDLTAERLCLQTPPRGFNDAVLPDISTSTDGYSSSVFQNVGDAGAGHFANGSLYRLFIRKNSDCYEFFARVGQSQYKNYPEGAIKEFTADMEQKLKGSIEQTIQNIYLLSGEKHLFP